MEKLEEFTALVEAELTALGCPAKAKMQTALVVDEIFSNIARYAYSGAGGMLEADIGSEENPGAVVLVFKDSGVPFNPLEQKEPDIAVPAAQRQIGGLGILMIKKLMDEIAYEYRDGQNILTIRKYI